MRSFAVVVLLASLAVPAAAAAECRQSAGGAYSVDVELSPAAGILCLMDVRVHRGRACGGEPAWAATLGCDETRWMVVADDGTLVSLRAPRPYRRGWEIVRTFAPEGDRIVVRSIRFDELPGAPPAPARPRLTLDPDGLRVGEGADAPVIALDRLRRLGRRTGRRGRR